MNYQLGTIEHAGLAPFIFSGKNQLFTRLVTVSQRGLHP